MEPASRARLSLAPDLEEMARRVCVYVCVCESANARVWGKWVLGLLSGVQGVQASSRPTTRMQTYKPADVLTTSQIHQVQLANLHHLSGHKATQEVVADRHS